MVFGEYEQALGGVQRALQLQPNASSALEYSGYVHRRQGKWDRTLDKLKRFRSDQDPRRSVHHKGASRRPMFFCASGKKGKTHLPGVPSTIDPHEATGMRDVAAKFS